MRKVFMALLLGSAGMCAVAQTHPMSMAGVKPPMMSLELLRAPSTCGPLLDCTIREPDHGFYGLKVDPCASSPFGCQLRTSEPEWKSPGYIGGAKLRADVGSLSFAFGRHRDNLILAQATFVEGTYRMGEGSLVFGVLRAPRIADSHGAGLAYIAWHMAF